MESVTSDIIVSLRYFLPNTLSPTLSVIILTGWNAAYCFSTLIFSLHSFIAIEQFLFFWFAACGVSLTTLFQTV